MIYYDSAAQEAMGTKRKWNLWDTDKEVMPLAGTTTTNYGWRHPDTRYSSAPEFYHAEYYFEPYKRWAKIDNVDDGDCGYFPAASYMAANYRWFEQEYGDSKVLVFDEGYIYVDLWNIHKKQFKELREVIEGLVDYPSINDQLVSEIEAEWFEDWYENYGMPFSDEPIGTIDDYYAAMDALNVYPEYQEGGVYISSEDQENIEKWLKENVK